MSKIRRKKDKEKLANMLDEYHKEKCLGPRNCKLCTFSMNNHTGCALNLVCNSVEHDLSSYKEESDEQWNHILYGHDRTKFTKEDTNVETTKDVTFLDRIDQLNNTTNKGNFFNPPITDKEAIGFLRDYLLGKDWYDVNPVSHDQVNTSIVHSILYKYSRKYRKDYKVWKKQREKK